MSDKCAGCKYEYHDFDGIRGCEAKEGWYGRFIPCPRETRKEQIQKGGDSKNEKSSDSKTTL